MIINNEVIHFLNWLGEKWISAVVTRRRGKCRRRICQKYDNINRSHHECIVIWIYLKSVPWICHIFSNNLENCLFLSWQHKLLFTCITVPCASSLSLAPDVRTIRSHTRLSVNTTVPQHVLRMASQNIQSGTSSRLKKPEMKHLIFHVVLFSVSACHRLT